MKRVLSIFIAAVMMVACFSIATSAATQTVNYSVVPTLVGDTVVVNVEATITHDVEIVKDHSFYMYMYFDTEKFSPKSLTIIGDWADPENQDNSEWLGTNEPNCVEMQYAVLKSFAANETVVLAYTVVFDIIGTLDSTETFQVDLGYGTVEVDQYDEISETYPIYVAPESASSATRKGCEACGVESGVRFISKIDTTTADLAGYGMRISYNGVTKDVDSTVNYSVDGAIATYTVVVTNAPAGAKFAVAPYAKYANGVIAFAEAGEYVA